MVELAAVSSVELLAAMMEHLTDEFIIAKTPEYVRPERETVFEEVSREVRRRAGKDSAQVIANFREIALRRISAEHLRNRVTPEIMSRFNTAHAELLDAMTPLIQRMSAADLLALFETHIKDEHEQTQTRGYIAPDRPATYIATKNEMIRRGGGGQAFADLVTGYERNLAEQLLHAYGMTDSMQDNNGVCRAELITLMRRGR